MTAIARSPAPHVVIVGGGGTGGALALDLVLRGLRVTLVERGEITSGTTGRHHGLLHSRREFISVWLTTNSVCTLQTARVLRAACLIRPCGGQSSGCLGLLLVKHCIQPSPERSTRRARV